MPSKLERARQATKNLRKRLESAEPIRALSAFGGGAAMGALERRGTVPATVMGMPSKPVIGTGLYLIASNSSLGRTMHAVAAGAGAGVLGAYGYAAGKAGTLVAGEEDLDEVTEEDLD